MTRRSKAEQAARDGLLKNLTYLVRESWIPTTVAEEIPEAWHTLIHDLECDDQKVKVTLYLDRSVAKFYRAMGQGYQARINRLLATYAQMHVAREIKLEEKLKERVGWEEKPLEAGDGPQVSPAFLEAEAENEARKARGEDITK